LAATKIRAVPDVSRHTFHETRIMVRRITDPGLCRLKAALGEVQKCPEEACPFWEPGGAVLDGRCAFERVDLPSHPDVATLLLRIRSELEPFRDAEEAVHEAGSAAR
jgi:hypothetical protein